MLTNFRKSVSNIYVRLSATVLLMLLNSAIANGQKGNIVGVFRDIGIGEQAVTYVEFKNDSTVILKRLPLGNPSDAKSIVTQSGIWRTIGDTVIINITPYSKSTQDSIPAQLIYLIKNEDVLYTRRFNTGKFVKDGPFSKVKGRLVRLPQEFLEEYTNLK